MPSAKHVQPLPRSRASAGIVLLWKANTVKNEYTPFLLLPLALYLSWHHVVCDTPSFSLGQSALVGHLPGSCPRPPLDVGECWETVLMLCQHCSAGAKTGVLSTPFLLPMHSTVLWGLLWGNEVCLSQIQYNLQPLFHAICIIVRCHLIYISSNCFIGFICHYWNLFLITHTT